MKDKDNKKDKDSDVDIPEKDIKLDNEKDSFKDVLSSIVNKKKD